VADDGNQRPRIESRSKSRPERAMSVRMRNGTGSAMATPMRRIRLCHAGRRPAIAVAGSTVLSVVSVVTVW
jgi:hypothetical protein